MARSKSQNEAPTQSCSVPPLSAEKSEDSVCFKTVASLTDVNNTGNAPSKSSYQSSSEPENLTNTKQGELQREPAPSKSPSM